MASRAAVKSLFFLYENSVGGRGELGGGGMGTKSFQLALIYTGNMIFFYGQSKGKYNFVHVSQPTLHLFPDPKVF